MEGMKKLPLGLDYNNQEAFGRVQGWVASGKIDEVPVDTLWALRNDLRVPGGKGTENTRVIDRANESMFSRMRFENATPEQQRGALRHFMETEGVRSPDLQGLQRLLGALAPRSNAAGSTAWVEAIQYLRNPFVDQGSIYKQLKSQDLGLADTFARSFMEHSGDGIKAFHKLYEADSDLSKLSTDTLKYARQCFISRGELKNVDLQLYKKLDQMVRSRGQ